MAAAAAKNDDSPLFQPLEMAGGEFTVPNRVWMAPMSRLRNFEPLDIPGPLAKVYYSQRAGAGIILSEAVHVMASGKGYAGAPGLWNSEQQAAWKEIADAVHEAGGRIMIQLYHTGRVSHPGVQPFRQTPIAPSPIDPGASATIRNAETGALQRVPCPRPREATAEDLEAVKKAFAHSTKLAKEAGFDGVELNAAHGYFLHQFLNDSSNIREDDYGGSALNRCRYPLEVLDAMIEAWDAEHISVRLSPIGNYQGIMPASEEEAIHETLVMVKELAKRPGLMFLHVSEPDWLEGPKVSMEFRKQIREAFPGVIVSAGGYTQEKAEMVLNAGLSDAVCFGRMFLCNRDLPERMRRGVKINKLAPVGPNKLYGPGPEGYTDYLTIEEEAVRDAQRRREENAKALAALREEQAALTLALRKREKEAAAAIAAMILMDEEEEKMDHLE